MRILNKWCTPTKTRVIFGEWDHHSWRVASLGIHQSGRYGVTPMITKPCIRLWKTFWRKAGHERS